ncbi:GULP1, partial [Cordylochernes scorpioides]
MSDMRNRHHVQPTWSTSCIPGDLTGYYQHGQLSPGLLASLLLLPLLLFLPPWDRQRQESHVLCHQVITDQYPLHRISYCADDKSDKKFFSFVAKESEEKEKPHRCFVFISDKLVGPPWHRGVAQRLNAVCRRRRSPSPLDRPSTWRTAGSWTPPAGSWRCGARSCCCRKRSENFANGNHARPQHNGIIPLLQPPPAHPPRHHSPGGGQGIKSVELVDGVCGWGCVFFLISPQQSYQGIKSVELVDGVCGWGCVFFLISTQQPYQDIKSVELVDGVCGWGCVFFLISTQQPYQDIKSVELVDGVCGWGCVFFLISTQQSYQGIKSVELVDGVCGWGCVFFLISTQQSYQGIKSVELVDGVCGWGCVFFFISTQQSYQGIKSVELVDGVCGWGCVFFFISTQQSYQGIKSVELVDGIQQLDLLGSSPPSERDLFGAEPFNPRQNDPFEMGDFRELDLDHAIGAIDRKLSEMRVSCPADIEAVDHSGVVQAGFSQGLTFGNEDFAL